MGNELIFDQYFMVVARRICVPPNVVGATLESVALRNGISLHEYSVKKDGATTVAERIKDEGTTKCH